jgi:predicted DNA-binding transcriptional regulator AlpA
MKLSENNQNKSVFIKKSEITKITTLSGSTIDRLESEGKFPVRILLGNRKIVWSAKDIYEWCEFIKNNKGYPKRGYY